MQDHRLQHNIVSLTHSSIFIAQKSKNASVRNQYSVCEGVDASQGTQMGDIMSTLIGPYGQLVRGGSAYGQSIIEDTDGNESTSDIGSNNQQEQQGSFSQSVDHEEEQFYALYPYLKLEDLSQREFNQKLKALIYPNRLLELGGLLEILDFEES